MAIGPGWQATYARAPRGVPQPDLRKIRKGKATGGKAKKPAPTLATGRTPSTFSVLHPTGPGYFGKGGEASVLAKAGAAHQGGILDWAKSPAQYVVGKLQAPASFVAQAAQGHPIAALQAGFQAVPGISDAANLARQLAPKNVVLDKITEYHPKSLSQVSYVHDALKHLGPIAPVAGFAADVVGDPYSWVTLGSATTARTIATKGLEAGLAREGAEVAAKPVLEQAGAVHKVVKGASQRESLDVLPTKQMYVQIKVPGSRLITGSVRTGQRIGRRIAGKPRQLDIAGGEKPAGRWIRGLGGTTGKAGRVATQRSFRGGIGIRYELDVPQPKFLEPHLARLNSKTAKINETDISESLKRIVFPGGGLDKGTHQGMRVATHWMNAATAALRTTHVEPMADFIRHNKLDTHRLSRLVDNPAKYKPENDAERTFLDMHEELDKDVKKLLLEGGVSTPDQFRPNYVPHVGKTQKWRNTLSTRYGMTRQLLEPGFTKTRRFNTMDELEAQVGAIPKAGTHKSDVLQTDYLELMESHIRASTRSVAARQYLRAQGELYGAARRQAERPDLGEIEQRLAGAQGKVKELRAPRKLETQAARAAARATEAEARGLEQQLVGATRDYAAAPGERQQALERLNRGLGKLSKLSDAERAGSKGTQALAEVQAHAAHLVRTASRAGGDTSDVAKAAQDAIRAAHEGQMARSAGITAAVGRSMESRAAAAVAREAARAEMPGRELMHTPEGRRQLRLGPKQRVAGRGIEPVSASEYARRLSAWRHGLAPKPKPPVLRGGVRGVKAYREAIAGAKPVEVGGRATSREGARRRRLYFDQPKPTGSTIEQTERGELMGINKEYSRNVQEAARNLRTALRGRDKTEVREARIALREARRTGAKQREEVGRLGASRVGTHAEIRMAERDLMKVKAERKRARRLDTKLEKEARRAPKKPYEAKDPATFHKDVERLLNSTDDVERAIGKRAQETGYIEPEEVQKSFKTFTDRLTYATQGPEELKVFSRFLADVNARWKRVKLGLPTRLIRDSLEDSLLLHVEGGSPEDVIDGMKLTSVAYGQTKKIGVGGKFAQKVEHLQDDTIQTEDGTKYTYEELANLSKVLGVHNAGQVPEAGIQASATHAGVASQTGSYKNLRGISGLTGGKLRPAGYGRPTQGLLTLNNERDNLFRNSLFISYIKRGYDPYAAAKRVSTIYFDYSDLSKTMMQARRNLAPFLTFTTKSIPLLGRLAVERPSYFTTLGHLQENLNTASGADTSNLGSPTSPDVFGLPLPGAFNRWLGGAPGEPSTIDPQSMSRLSSLNILPFPRGGSDIYKAPALAAGQLLGGVGPGAVAAVAGYDIRGGKEYGDSRVLDPATYLAMSLMPGGQTTTKYDDFGQKQQRGNPFVSSLLGLAAPQLQSWVSPALQIGGEAFGTVTGRYPEALAGPRSKARQKIPSWLTGIGPRPADYARARAYAQRRGG